MSQKQKNQQNKNNQILSHLSKKLKDKNQSIMSLINIYIQQSNNKPKKSFIKMKRIAQIDDSLLILNQDMSLNVNYTSPILQTVDFVQQYEKYRLRTILSALPISIEEFQRYYSQIQNSIMFKYKKYMINTMKNIYQLLNFANCLKIEQLRMYTSVFEQFRNDLLQRNQLDPYQFCPQQFFYDKNKVLEMIKFSQKYLNCGETTNQKIDGQPIQKNIYRKIKEQIQNLTKKINSKSKQMMDKMIDCKVHYPYRPQNCKLQKIDSQKLLDSFHKKIKTKNAQFDQILQQKYFSIEQALTKTFSFHLRKYSQRNHGFSKSIINEYNQNCKSTKCNQGNFQKKLICPPMLRFDKSKYFDNNQNQNEKNYNSIKSCLAHKNLKINFNKQIRFIDLQKGKEQLIQMDNKLFQHLQNNFQEKNQNQIDFQIKPLKFNPNKFQVQNSKKKIILSKISQQQSNVQNISWKQLHFDIDKNGQYNILLFSLFDLKNFQTQKNIIRPSDKKISINEDLRNQKPFSKKKAMNQNNQVMNELNDNFKHQYSFKKQQNSNNQVILNEDQTKLKNQAYQSQRKAQQLRKFQNLSSTINMKTYQMFCGLTINPKTKKGGLQIRTYHTIQQISRYGIQIKKNPFNYGCPKQIKNQHLKILDVKENQNLNKFFFYYFKQRFYRQNKQITQNSQIPIFMSIQTQDQFLSAKMMKKLLPLIKKYKFFILWSQQDILIYEEKNQFYRKKGQLKIYSLNSLIFTQKIVFQLNKRISQNFKIQPETNQNKIKKNLQLKYTFQEPFIDSLFINLNNGQFKNTIYQILYKIQLIHRTLYNRHKDSLQPIRRIEKGKQLYQQITQNIQKQTNLSK